MACRMYDINLIAPEIEFIRTETARRFARRCEQPGYTVELHGGPLDRLFIRVDRSPQPIGMTYSKEFEVPDGGVLQVVYRRAEDGRWTFDLARRLPRATVASRAC